MKLKLPHISRFIPVHVSFLVTFFTSWVFVIGILTINARSISSPPSPSILGTSTNKRQTSLSNQRNLDQVNYEYWGTVTKKYPDYPDAYFMQAILAYKLGNKEDATILLSKALALNPNNETMRQFLPLLAQ